MIIRAWAAGSRVADERSSISGLHTLGDKVLVDAEFRLRVIAARPTNEYLSNINQIPVFRMLRRCPKRLQRNLQRTLETFIMSLPAVAYISDAVLAKAVMQQTVAKDEIQLTN